MSINEQSYIKQRLASELQAQSDRIEHGKFRLLAARLVDSVDALEGQSITYMLGKTLAVHNDAVRVALGIPSRLKTSEDE